MMRLDAFRSPFIKKTCDVVTSWSRQFLVGNVERFLEENPGWKKVDDPYFENGVWKQLVMVEQS